MAGKLAQYFAKVEGDEGYIPVEILSVSTSTNKNIFKITVDGETFEVDYMVSGNNLHSLLINNTVYSLVIDRHDSVYDVERIDDYFRIEILDEMKKFIKERVAKGLQGRQVIETQMPGLILKVLVEKGQEVKTGDPLMILVAMKMENEIRAPKDGTVQELFVQEGKTVGSGDKLVIIE
jgi:biotin carboxyl carrier protein